MISKKFKIDDENSSPYSKDYLETTYWHDIGDGVKWRNHKHWMTGVLGAEGCTERFGDRSGCVRKIDGLDYVTAPLAVEQRHYKRGKHLISAVLSYPGGMSFTDGYFWEIYSLKGNSFEDIDRFFGKNAERNMERKIKKLIGKK